jgi:hypothetical protein
MPTATISPKKAEKVREDWLALVEELIEQVESWAKKRGWGTHRDTKPIQESPLGRYRVPVLSILAPAGRVQLDPIARYAIKSDGRVDLMAWPSCNRVMLIRAGDRWKIKTDSGISWPQKWSQRTFVGLVESLNLDD